MIVSGVRAGGCMSVCVCMRMEEKKCVSSQSRVCICGVNVCESWYGCMWGGHMCVFACECV